MVRKLKRRLAHLNTPLVKIRVKHEDANDQTTLKLTTEVSQVYRVFDRSASSHTLSRLASLPFEQTSGSFS